MESLMELSNFLQPSQRLDVKSIALSHILGMTGTTDGKDAILQNLDVLSNIFQLTMDPNRIVAKDATLCLINLSAKEEDALIIFRATKQIQPVFYIVNEAVKEILVKDSELSDAWTMVLSNLTRVEKLAHDILESLEDKENVILNLTKAFDEISFNKNSKLNYLGPIFCNLSQSSIGRKIFCDSDYNILERLLSFVSYKESLVRRGGIIGLLKNICFDPIYHHIILNGDDILYAILYPLCGPEEYTDEEYELFPLALQYLPEDKKREEDPDLRKMLLECLLQLCATKVYREHLRSKGVYEILREYHKWEAKIGKDSECLLACENVVDILIKKEEEISLDNYKEIEIPSHLSEQFVKDDENYLREII